MRQEGNKVLTCSGAPVLRCVALEHPSTRAPVHRSTYFLPAFCLSTMAATSAINCFAS